MIRQPHELAIEEWVRSAVPSLVDIVFESNKMPRVDEPYATINVPTHGTLGTPDIRTTDVPDTDQFEQVRSMPQQGSVSVKIYGDGANGLMSELVDSIHSPAILELNEAAGIVVAQVLLRLDGYADRSSSNERRSMADFMFRHIRTRTESVYSIENMELTPTIS